MRNVRVFRLLTFCVFIVSVGLHVTAFSSSFWFKRRDIYGWLVHHGLWTFCDYYRSGGIDNKCLKLVNRYDDFESEYSMIGLVPVSLCQYGDRVTSKSGYGYAGNGYGVFVGGGWVLGNNIIFNSVLDIKR